MIFIIPRTSALILMIETNNVFFEEVVTGRPLLRLLLDTSLSDFYHRSIGIRTTTKDCAKKLLLKLLLMLFLEGLREQ